MKVEGHCLCGAIAYEAEVQPGTVTVCHCSDCQTHSGSAFRATISAPAAGFRLVKGSPRTFAKTASNGSTLVLAFCENCGTPLYGCAAGEPAAYSLPVGTLQQRHELGTPKKHLWTRRRLPWVPLPEGVETFEGQP